MADFDPPSFSLGLDLDADVHQSAPESPIHATTSGHSRSNNGGHDVVFVEALGPDPLPPTLPFSCSSSDFGSWRELPWDVGGSPKEMSSRDDRQRDKHSVIQSYSACSSSKLSLHSQRTQSTQFEGVFKDKENRAASIAPTSGHSKTGSSQWISPKSTVGPDRKIHFLDSELRDPSFINYQPEVFKLVHELGRQCKPAPYVTGYHQKKAKYLSNIFMTDNLSSDLSSKTKEKLDTAASDDLCEAYFRSAKDSYISQSMKEVIGVCGAPFPPNCFSNEKDLSSIFHPDNLWEVLSSNKKEKLVIPAFDDFCEAYFRSVEDLYVSRGMKEVIGASGALPPNCFSNETRFHLHRNNPQEDVDSCGKLSNPLPPAYQYFFHNNQRIQRLVRDRLPYFFPLGPVSKGGNQQLETSVIDYMSQFDQRDIPIQVNISEKWPLKESSKGKNKLNNANVQVSPQASGSWVNPKSCSFSMKDARTFGLCMEGCSSRSGHWYTGQDGTKVYVTKTGHELTGQTAYRKNRKESVVGFKKPRKQAATKKGSNKTAAKKSVNKASNKKSSNKSTAKKSVSKASNKKSSNKTTAKKSVSEASNKKSSSKSASKKRSNQGSTSNRSAKKRRL